MLIRQVKGDLRAWKLNRVVWVLDTGFASEENRRYLQGAGGHFIVGEKLWAGRASLAALACPGRYRNVRANLEVKQVWVGEGERRRRFVVCGSLHEAARDAARREVALARIADELAALERKKTAEERRDAEALPLAHPSLGRYLARRQDPQGTRHRRAAPLPRDRARQRPRRHDSPTPPSPQSQSASGPARSVTYELSKSDPR